MDQRKVLDQQTLDEIIHRIVEVAQPDRIILFGSAARDQMGANSDSDVDLLVIKSGNFHRGRLTEEIYMNLFGVGQAVDVVVVTPEDVARYRDSLALVIRPALEEGRARVYWQGLPPCVTSRCDGHNRRVICTTCCPSCQSTGSGRPCLSAA